MIKIKWFKKNREERAARTPSLSTLLAYNVALPFTNGTTRTAISQAMSQRYVRLSTYASVDT